MAALQPCKLGRSQALPASSGLRHPALRALAPHPHAAPRPAVAAPARCGGVRAEGRRPQPRGDEDSWSLETGGGELSRYDSEKEQGRKYMRTLSTFTFKRWAFHRSTDRYLRHMLGIFQSRIVLGLAWPLLSAGSTAALLCLYEDALTRGDLPPWMPALLMPSLPFDITSFALSLLLVFRTNTSYDRWLQAVTAWGNIATRSRDTLRQLLAYSAPAHAAASGGALPTAATGRWLVAFSRALKAQLTEDSDLRAELTGILTPSELDLLCGAYHPPSFALAVVTELAAAAPLRDSQRIRVDENLTFFEDAMGACERLLRTPIPLSYTRHTSRFMVIWLSALPLGLWSSVGWGTVPLTMIISFLLLGIEEIGVAIEEPFSILPLEDLCHDLEVRLSDVLDDAPASKAAAREAASAAAAAALAADAAAEAALLGGASDSAGGSSGSSIRGGEVAAAAAANAVAPLAPGALGRASFARERVPAAASSSADAIFSSVDVSDM